jgi:cell division protein FtsQ
MTPEREKRKGESGKSPFRFPLSPFRSGYRLGCLSAILVGIAVWIVQPPAVEALREHPYFAIHELVVTGCGPALTQDDVRAWLGLTGTSTVWEASPGWVRARLLAHPRIAEATARRSFPGRLEIALRERRPVAIAVLDDLHYVDRGGTLIGPLEPYDSRDYPMITGLDTDDAPGARQWLVRRALRLLRRCDRETCIGELSEVHVDAAQGVIVYPAEPRLPILLGWGSWPAKLARAEQALRAWSGGAERLVSVDTRFRNQVVLTTRPAPAPPPSEKGGSGGISQRPRRAPTKKSPLAPLFQRGESRVEI